MSAFNSWTYNVSLESLGNSSTTMDTADYQYNDLQPNKVYIFNIYPFFPRALGTVGNVHDGLISSWIVQTVDNC